MTVRVERSFSLPVSRERVWSFIADPGNRAQAISVVADYRLSDDEGRRATWEVELPIPLVRKTVTVETKDIVRDPPRYVKFQGRSKAMTVTGEHELHETDEGCRLDNRFVVEGRLPGVETFFRRHLDDELENLRRAAERDVRPEVESSAGSADADNVDGDGTDAHGTAVADSDEASSDEADGDRP